MPASREVKWRGSDGASSLRYLGRDGNSLPLPVQPAPVGRQLRRRRSGGRAATASLVRADYGDDVESYEPHDCSFTIGRCRYTVTPRRHGSRERMIRVTTLTGGDWRYRLYRDREGPRSLVESGGYTADAFGAEIDGFATGTDGNTSRFQRID